MKREADISVIYNDTNVSILGYIGEIENGYLVPGTIGMGLVEGYDSVNLPLAYPELRAGLERDLKLICTGERVPDVVLKEQIEKYKEVYRVITTRIEAMDASLANRYISHAIRRLYSLLTAYNISYI